MKIDQLSPNAHAFWAIAAFLLCVACVLGIVRALGAKMKRRFLVGYALLLAVSLFFALGFENICDHAANGYPLFHITRLFQALPAALAPAALLPTAIVAALLWRRQETWLRRELTSDSVREGLDNMPDGICFGTKEGIPLLVNRSMQEISSAALGMGVLDTDTLRHRLETGDVLPGCRTERRSSGLYLHLPDDSIWAIRHRSFPFQNGEVRECVAYDVTRQYQKYRELDRRNAHLAAVNEQLRAYNSRMNDLIRDREILTAKLRIHDDVGRSLLALRSYLSRGDVNRKALISMWRFTISALKREAASSDADDPFESLKQAASAIGVQLRFEGDLPEYGRNVITAAIHECLTNAVKHADGSELTIRSLEGNGTIAVEFTHDGQPPRGVVEEKGGLRTLRSMVEQYGGAMEIRSMPNFRLTIRFVLPK